MHKIKKRQIEYKTKNTKWINNYRNINTSIHSYLLTNEVVRVMCNTFSDYSLSESPLTLLTRVSWLVLDLNSFVLNLYSMIRITNNFTEDFKKKSVTIKIQRRFETIQTEKRWKKIKNNWNDNAVKNNMKDTWKYICNRAIGLMSRVFVNVPVDRGSIPGRVIRKTQK